MKKLLAAAALVAALLSACTGKSQMEKDLDKMISKMTLEEKIGQMIQIEISKISWQNPEFDFYNIVKLGPEELGALIDRYRLGDRYDAQDMCRNRDPENWNSLLPFYSLSIDLGTADGFKLDREKMKEVFGDLHVGSILNMIGNKEASPLELWQKSIAEMEAASVEFNGIPMIYGLDQVHGPDSC